MSLLLMITQLVLLLYDSPLFGWSSKLDKFRFVCYVLMILYGCFLFARLRLRRPRNLDLVACGILVFAFLSHLYSLNAELTLLRSWINLLMYVAVFWALWNSCKTPNDILRLIQTLLTVWLLFYVANAVFLFVRPAQAFNIFHEDITLGGYKRFTGITTNPNGIGNLSAIILPLAIWNYRHKKTFLSLFLVMAVTFSFFFSFSRNAFICSVLGTGLYLYLSTKKKRGLLVMGTVLLIALMVGYTDVFGRFFLPKALIRPESLDVLGGRVEAWGAAMELIKKRPWLGYGFGVENLVFDYFSFRFQIHAGAYVHNSFLGLALQLGWGAAILVYLFFAIFFLKSFFKLSRLRSESESMRTLTIALYASTLGAFWTSFFESWLYAAGGIIAFTFYTCLMFLMRMLDFYKAAPQMTHVRPRG